MGKAQTTRTVIFTNIWFPTLTDTTGWQSNYVLIDSTLYSTNDLFYYLNMQCREELGAKGKTPALKQNLNTILSAVSTKINQISKASELKVAGTTFKIRAVRVLTTYLLLDCSPEDAGLLKHCTHKPDGFYPLSLDTASFVILDTVPYYLEKTMNKDVTSIEKALAEGDFYRWLAHPVLFKKPD